MSYSPEKIEELRALVWLRFQSLSTDRPSADNIRVFVKPEPHKQQKLEEGRYRLISAVSLIDTMVDRILFGWLAETALENVGRTPCAVGWAPVKSGWRSVRQRFNKAVCLDKSAWDWTVQSWLIEAYHRFVNEIALNAPDWWRKAVHARFTLLFRAAKFQFRNGTVIAQPEVGVMKSGCYLTLLLNSVGQVLVHIAAMLRLNEDPDESMPFAMGDDTVQHPKGIRDLESYVRELERLGCKVKGAKVRSDVEFAGFQMTDLRCVPAYRMKHLYKLEYATDLPSYLRSMQLLYGHDSTMYNFFNGVAARKCPEATISASTAMMFMG